MKYHKTHITTAELKQQLYELEKWLKEEIKQLKEQIERLTTPLEAEFLRLSEVKEFLNISTGALHNLIRRKKLCPIYKVDGLIWVKSRELRDGLEQARVNGEEWYEKLPNR